MLLIRPGILNITSWRTKAIFMQICIYVLVCVCISACVFVARARVFAYIVPNSIFSYVYVVYVCELTIRLRHAAIYATCNYVLLSSYVSCHHFNFILLLPALFLSQQLAFYLITHFPSLLLLLLLLLLLFLSVFFLSTIKFLLLF